MLITAAVFIFLIGLAHSYLGERFIISRLFKRDNLPKIYGSDSFTKGTIRFAWHLTTVAWFCLAVICIQLSSGSGEQEVTLSISIAFFISCLLAIFYTKGKHFSWPVFLLIAITTFPFNT